MELLFFASVGDPARCRVICETWDISVADRACCDYDRRTPLCVAPRSLLHLACCRVHLRASTA